MIALQQEPTLAYRKSEACDFARIVEVGIRMDRKQAHPNPAGEVALGAVRLHGTTDVNLDGPSGWRLEPGVGEHRRSRLEASSNGFFAVRYDFTPAPNPAVSVDLRTWGPTGDVTRVVSDRTWQAEKRPARVKDRKGAWIVLDGFRPEDLGPHAASLPPVGDAMRLVFKGREVRVK